MEIREIDWCVTYYANNASNLVAMRSKVVKTASFMRFTAMLPKTSMLLNKMDSL